VYGALRRGEAEAASYTTRWDSTRVEVTVATKLACKGGACSRRQRTQAHRAAAETA
jgi:hypothetical protein